MVLVELEAVVAAEWADEVDELEAERELESSEVEELEPADVVVLEVAGPEP